MVLDYCWAAPRRGVAIGWPELRLRLGLTLKLRLKFKPGLKLSIDFAT